LPPRSDSVSLRGMEFPTTRLSLVLAASANDGTHARTALAELCRIYWRPLYTYVRRQGHDAGAAEDLTQSFIARLIEKDSLRRFRQERGRFRSFLLASLKNFLANERDSAQAQKRGGGVTALPLEQAGEARDNTTPDRLFERQWALDVLSRALDQVREESANSGKGPQFELLKGYLTGGGELPRYRDLGRELSMSETAVKVAVHRLRLRFHEALRHEISMTVSDESAIGDEIRYLLAVLSA
jgi:RNA polymerase sigma factor (sigma-70 family)